MTPVIRFRIDFTDSVNLGPGKIALLEAIIAKGSISDAARSLGMSYRRAWMLINSLKQGFSEPITVSATGGKGGGGAQVTPSGVKLIHRYRTLEQDIAQRGIQTLAEIIPAVIVGQSSSGKSGKKRLAKILQP
jgi:molybdate transport system regulatory protein